MVPIQVNTKAESVVPCEDSINLLNGNREEHHQKARDWCKQFRNWSPHPTLGKVSGTTFPLSSSFYLGKYGSCRVETGKENETRCGGRLLVPQAHGSGKRNKAMGKSLIWAFPEQEPPPVVRIPGGDGGTEERTEALLTQEQTPLSLRRGARVRISYANIKEWVGGAKRRERCAERGKRRRGRAAMKRFSLPPRPMPAPKPLPLHKPLVKSCHLDRKARFEKIATLSEKRTTIDKGFRSVCISAT